MNILIYLSLLPSILLGNHIYKNDKVEKEPTKLLFSCFVGGVISGIIVIILFFLGLDYEMNPNDQLSILIYSFVTVSFVEELAKFLLLYFITYKNKEFNYLYDSVVYASFLGLGFAILENLIYILGSIDLITIISRGFITLPVHVFFGVFMGYYLGLAKKCEIVNDKKGKYKYLLGSLFVPVLLHGFFDYCLFTGDTFSSLLFILFVLVLYIASFNKIKELSEISKSLYE